MPPLSDGEGDCLEELMLRGNKVETMSKTNNVKDMGVFICIINKGN
jgi:hypothetical protein